MHSGLVLRLASALLAFVAVPALAGDWERYENRRFGYAIDIPPGFSEVVEADNGDRGVSTSPDGNGELRVWGAYLVGRDFASDVAERVQSDASDGWTISYDRRKEMNASWSGSKGGRVFYARALTGCDGAAIYFRLEYDQTWLKTYDPIIAGLVKSLHGTC